MVESEITLEVLEWLKLRLKRAKIIEKKLNKLFKKEMLTDSEKKEMTALSVESKQFTIKEVLSVYQTLNDKESLNTFEDFE